MFLHHTKACVVYTDDIVEQSNKAVKSLYTVSMGM